MYQRNVWTLWSVISLVMLLILAACGGAPAATEPEDAPAAEEAAPAEEEATPEEEAMPEEEAATEDETATEDEADATEEEATTEDETATEDEAATEDGTATEDEADATEEEAAGAVVDESLSGELVLYTTRSEALINNVLEAFNEQYPNITVTSVNGSNSELGARILEEQANPQAHVFINSDTLTMEDLYNNDIFQANESELVAAVPEQYRADDGSWTALTLRGRVLMYNTDLLSEEDVPTSLTGLSDPEWSGRIGSADSTNGAMVATIVALNRLLDEETTTGWIQGLVDNNTLFSGSHTDIRQAVGNGEIEMGLVNHYYYFLSLEEGAPVGVVWPDQGEDDIGLIVNSTNIGILQGTEGETLELAQAFVDFMLDTTGQTIYAQGNFEWPIKEDIPLADGVPSPDDFTIADINLKTLVDDAPTAREQIQTVGMP